MKRILFIVLALAFFLGQVIPAHAAAWDLSDSKWIISNDASTGKTSFIATGVIRPGKDRVLKVTVTPTDGRSDCFVGLYDCTTAAGTLVSALEGEIEAGRDEGSAYIEYIRPLRIFNGVTILQGPYTIVMLEWEKVIP